jgi:phenylalanyl-tRNA synthetase beta chain
MGDVVLDIAITPNIARNANILGVAREIAALTDAQLKEPSYEVEWRGPPLEGRVRLEIQHPELNPRFVLGLIEGVKIGPSPYWVQRRLRLAGMRPINNIVDATNYVMLEIGEPLHAFDFDVLLERAGGETPSILTRLADPGERLTTLDGIERELDDFTVLVADSAGALSIAGVMGGAESEVSEQTTNMLLEGAAWNFINIRRTTASQKLTSDASYRFERGVHPAMAERGVRRGLNFVAQLAGGEIAEGLVDVYPLPPVDSTVEITPTDVERWLGIRLEVDEIAEILDRLGFEVEVDDQSARVTTPDHRLDIGQGVDGQADLIEEIARIYGYDRIPETQIADRIPPQYGNPKLEREERVRDVLVGLGLQEVVTYRLTSPERETRILSPEIPPDDRPYVRLANPIASDRVVLRHSLLASVLEIVERNVRIRDRIALFEIGQVYLTSEEGDLPEEPLRLVIALSGPRSLPAWQRSDPGKCARILIGERQVGVLGELHPKVRERYDLPERPVVTAELDLEVILESISEGHAVEPVPAFPPVLEDLAVVVEEEVHADEVEALLRRAGGHLLIDVKLFDLYRGEQIPEGKKSLAYSMVYQAPDRTLTDEEVAKVRARVIKKLESDLGAKLRD